MAPKADVRPIEYEWVKNLYLEAKERNIEFYFHQSGSMFLKDGKNIGKWNLKDQIQCVEDIRHELEKVSSTEVKDGDVVIIYYRELTDPNTKTYSYFAIGKDGTRHEVTDVSDSIKYWESDSRSIEWIVRDDGDNFLTLLTYDTMMGRYYSILPGGSDQNYISDSMINKGQIDGTQWKMIAVRLLGGELGNYGSRIENWVFPMECFYGIRYDAAAKSFVPVEAGDSEEIEFYFAVVDTDNTDESDPDKPENKNTVVTVDSVAMGITIKMYDFESGDGTAYRSDRSSTIEEALTAAIPMLLLTAAAPLCCSSRTMKASWCNIATERTR